MDMTITEQQLDKFVRCLQNEEKSIATIRKYARDARRFAAYLGDSPLTQDAAVSCKAALTRSNIWREMKQLCRTAGMAEEKVFPHNLRHLFARSFYALDTDLGKLADLLGHSSIETTRLYIRSTGAEHRRCLERMRLVI